MLLCTLTSAVLATCTLYQQVMCHGNLQRQVQETHIHTHGLKV